MAAKTDYNWSNDPVLLKELLDAGNRIVAMHVSVTELVHLFARDEEYWCETEGAVLQMKHRFGNWKFIDPRPRLLPLRWCCEDAFSINSLKARDEWKDSRGLLHSGRIRYTINEKGYWRIFLEGDFGSFAHGTCTQDEAKAKIQKWREDNLFMPLQCPQDIAPSELVWRKNHNDFNEHLCEYDNWTFSANFDGSWVIFYRNSYMAGEDEPTDGLDMDSAKSKIHEWRVNHIKSMIE